MQIDFNNKKIVLASGVKVSMKHSEIILPNDSTTKKLKVNLKKLNGGSSGIKSTVVLIGKLADSDLSYLFLLDIHQ
jgi:hypothetical protein